MDKLDLQVRKADMDARSNYDVCRLVFPRPEFIHCTYEEEKEEIVFHYDIAGYQCFSEIKSERRDTILINLIDCKRLLEVCQKYRIQLSPENLYFNIHNQVFVLHRDVYERGTEFDYNDFIDQYRALIGFSLQEKYSFEDYLHGGMDLLGKDKFLSSLLKLKTIEEITAYLQEALDTVLEEYRKNKVMVDKKRYRWSRRKLVLTSILAGVFLGISAYLLLWVVPYEQDVNQANEQFLRKRYNEVTDILGEYPISRLSVSNKYILAYSFVQGENLTTEQKNNIISAMSLDTNEKVLDYWIYLGQLEVESAEEIAQQISQEDLLLYAYLKEKNMLENNIDIDGTEKKSRLETLNQEIETLSGENTQ